jgi:type VI secretion system protein ImpB
MAEPKGRVTAVLTDAPGGDRAAAKPFITLTMGDYAGNDPTKKPKKDAELKPVNINKDNFDAVMESMGVGVRISVPDRLSKDGADQKELTVRLSFPNLGAMGPAGIAEQVPPLKELLEMRKRLVDLANRTSDKEAADLLNSIIMADSDAKSGNARG